MTAPESAALERLEAFCAAGEALWRLWESHDYTEDVDALLGTGYPEVFPSFDQLVIDLKSWTQEVKVRVEEG